MDAPRLLIHAPGAPGLRWLGLAGFGNVPRELLAGLAELRQLQAHGKQLLLAV